MEQQLADIASLGSEEEREELQQMIQEVLPGTRPCGILADQKTFQRQHGCNHKADGRCSDLHLNE